MTEASDFNGWLFSLHLDQRPIKRSVTIAGHATSISLEPVFWEALQDMAKEEGLSLAGTIAAIDRVRGPNGLPSAIRQTLFARRLSAR